MSASFESLAVFGLSTAYFIRKGSTRKRDD